MPETYVLDEPQIKVEDGKFWFTGKAVPVNASGGVLDYLKAAGVYNSKVNVYNGSVSFDDNFSISDSLEEVDQALATVDRKRLENDLEKNGWAFLMAEGNPGKFKDYKNNGFMANMNRVVQGLAAQKLRDEQRWKFDIRPLKAQEDVELMYSNDDFKKINDVYWKPLSEVIEKVARQRAVMYKMRDGRLEKVSSATEESFVPIEAASVWSCWSRVGARPFVHAGRPLDWNDCGVAALKKVALKA